MVVVKEFGVQQNKHFYQSDFDLDPMTLVLKLDLNSKGIQSYDRQKCRHTHTEKQII